LILETLLFARLKNDSGVAALVSDRIYPGVLLQGQTYPCLWYRTISRNPDFSMNGRAGYVTTRVQFDAMASTFEDAAVLLEAVRTALDGQWAPTGDTPEVFACFSENVRHEYSDDFRVHVHQLDVMVHHSE